MHKIKTVFTTGPKTWNKLPENVKKAINLNSFKKAISLFLKTEWFNSVLDFEIDKFVFFFTFTHLLWVDTLLLSWMNLLIYFWLFNTLITTMIKWTVHKITLYFFPYVRLPHLSCIILSCPVLSWTVFVLFKGVQQVPGFCLPLHLLHPVFVVFDDFDVIWFCIFDGNKTELNWTECAVLLLVLMWDSHINTNNNTDSFEH